MRIKHWKLLPCFFLGLLLMQMVGWGVATAFGAYAALRKLHCAIWLMRPLSPGRFWASTADLLFELMLIGLNQQTSNTHKLPSLSFRGRSPWESPALQYSLAVSQLTL